MKRKYKDIKFSAERLAIVELAIQIVAEYRGKGYALTLRQLYYQFVSRDAFPESWSDKATGSTNNERSYKKLGDIIADARLAGLLDWAAIEDRTRNVDGNPHWKSPADIIESCASQFCIDLWEGQDYRVEVWVEKDALEGVVGKVAKEMDVQFFSCRGYASMTSIWDAGQRLMMWAETHGQTPVILHLGDHDPSGIDMSRDIRERVGMFMDSHSSDLVFKRIALNEPQVKRYAPPPNPAKVTDSRFGVYQAEHGDESWELDALDPTVIDNLIRAEILKYRDEKKFAALEALQKQHRKDLGNVARRWDEVVQNGALDESP